MLGVTLFGLFLTPVFYVALRRTFRRRRPEAGPAVAEPVPEGPAE
jgi:HAE1 family hydrophobic/amphiphilic exporter-1